MSGSAFPQIPICYSLGTFIVTQERSLFDNIQNIRMSNHATLQGKRQPDSIWIRLVEVMSYEVVDLPNLLPVPCTEEIGPPINYLLR